MADNPITRKEKYLAKLTGSYTGNVPAPITRVEKYLYDLCQKGISGLTPEEIENAVNKYLKENPVQPGATTEQAAQIEQNKKDVASLKEDISTKITKFYASNQGETHLADSDNGKIQDMMLYGKSEQKQYSGKNLLNATLQTTTRNGVTCTANGDGTYTLNGTATDIAIFVVYYNFADVYGSASSLKMVGCPSGGSAQKYFLRSYRKGGNPEILDEYGSGISIGSFKETESNIAILVKSGVTVNNLIFKPMLTTDTTATYADFEPYTGGIPSPNPDYPQEIKSVVNPTVKVCGKNLLNPTFKTNTYSGVALTNNGDGTYTIEGTNNSSGELIFSLVPTVDEQKALYNSLIGKNVKFIVESGSTISGSVGRICFVFYNKTENRYSSEIYNGGNVTVPTGYDLSVVDMHINVGQTVPKTILKPMITTDLTATYDDFEPYHEQTVTIPYTLNAIPVNSGGNITIDGQQYIADYVDVERGKLVRCVKKLFLKQYQWSKAINKGVLRFYASTIDAVGIDGSKVIKNAFSISSHFAFITSTPDRIGTFITNADGTTANIGFAFSTDTTTSSDDFNNWILNNKPFVFLPVLKEELPLTSEQTQALKELATYYPVTNISVNSEQLDGYTVFNYPISMENGWNYVKQQIGDTRDYIYDMDARTQDTDLQAAEAYVNSEYAVALTELEV